MTSLNNRFEISVNSEIGKLEGVILHTPGIEMENMTPSNAEKALYSDVLNLSIASDEYNQLKTVLEKNTNVFQVGDLLVDVLGNARVRSNLVERICENENAEDIHEELLNMQTEELAKCLMEG